jgi:hypothetical protein
LSTRRQGPHLGHEWSSLSRRQMTASGRVDLFAEPTVNGRYLRKGVMDCIGFAQRRFPKRSPAQARDWILALGKPAPTALARCLPQPYPDGFITRLAFGRFVRPSVFAQPGASRAKADLRGGGALSS